MALPVTAFEAILQSKVNPPRTLCWKTQRVRHPELQLQRPKQITSRLTIAVVSSRFAVRQDAKHQITVGKERVGHPPTTGTALQWNSATQCATTATAGTILDMKYNFDLGAGDNGNVIGITNNRDSTRSQAFVYDSLNRIQTAGTANTSGTNCWGETYGIDAWANLSSLALPSSYSTSCSHETPFSYTIPSNNQLPGASGFTYDAAGNLMASGLGNYVYNAEHQMTSVTVASTTTTYSYDGDGKRVEKSGGKIYWYGGGSDALDETDLSGDTNNATFSEYVSFTGEKVARRDYQNNIFYYFADHLGTSREMVQAGQTSPCYDADF